MIKKADIFLFTFIFIFGLVISYWSLVGNDKGDTVVITCNDQIFGIYDLSCDQEIDVDKNQHHNHITIKDGMVSMTSSSCQNQVCVHTKPISETKDVIVCLPNKIIVEIISNSASMEGGNVDVISG